MTITHGQLIVAVLLAWSTGFLAGAALFYPLGRRHGIALMAAAWKKAMRDDWLHMKELNARTRGLRRERETGQGL